ncbi:MAG: 30S ribosomal protein S20 [Bacillota bacterium]|jgi:small subunit ribosomal protein S20
MPNIKSAKKRVIIAEARREKNAAAKSTLRTAIKKYEQAIADGNKEDAKDLLVKANRLIDKAAQTNLIHKNTAARQKSRLTLMYNNA